MKYWTTKFRTVQKDEKDVKVGIVAANNHYLAPQLLICLEWLTTFLPLNGSMDKDIDYNVELFATNGREFKSKQKTSFDYPTT